MTRDFWQRAQALFDDLVDIDPEEREQALQERARHTDPELCRVVAQLLRHDEQVRQEGFLDEPPASCAESLHREEDGLGSPQSGGANGVAVPALPPATPERGYPRVGETMGGFKLKSELGRGGMGVVFEALQPQLGRIVALKIILSDRFAMDDQRRFRNEAEILARLAHPNIVTIHDFQENNGQPFFWMEFCDKGNLKKKLEKDGPLSANKVAEIVETLAKAIDSAHQQNIIHRDLKLANILVTGNEVYKICDFGLAKNLDDPGLTLSGAVLGTPVYMAPEQRAGKNDVGRAADIYGLGGILYELLTAQPPRRVINDELTPPRKMQPKTPRKLETICLKCMQKDPANRYPTAAALAEDLRRFREAQPIIARPAGLLVGGGIAVLLFLVIIYFLSSPPRQVAGKTECSLEMVEALIQQGPVGHHKYDKAIQCLHEIIARNPSDSLTWDEYKKPKGPFKLRAEAFSKKGDQNPRNALDKLVEGINSNNDLDAIRCYEEAMKDKELFWAANNLATLLATFREKEKRERAYEIAGSAVKATGGECWQTLDTLAVAEAKIGKFRDAAEHARAAIKRAPDTMEAKSARLAEKLEHFVKDKPWSPP
jgi:tetratricopeptide (TPR) repeat protein